MNIFSKTSLFFVTSIIAVVFCASAQAQASPVSGCTPINTDLSYSTSGSGVLALQSLLVNLGYLSAKPTGYFGLATKAAVKAFQSEHAISATGFVGPLTRVAIATAQARNCSSGSAPVTTTVITPAGAQTPAPAPTSSPAPVSAPAAVSSSLGSITSPSVGQTLSLASTTVIRWTTIPSNIFNIVLEQPGGIGAGFAAMGLSPNTSGYQYVWKVGKVLTSQSVNSQMLSPGTYRLRLQGVNAGAASTDEVSGWFTVTNALFRAASVVPTSAPADDATAIVLFGSGFTVSTSVYFDANSSGVRANNKYVSTDGSVLVFTVPTTVSAGSHTLYISDTSNSSAPVTLPFTVSTYQ